MEMSKIENRSSSHGTMPHAHMQRANAQRAPPPMPPTIPTALDVTGDALPPPLSLSTTGNNRVSVTGFWPPPRAEMSDNVAVPRVLGAKRSRQPRVLYSAPFDTDLAPEHRRSVLQRLPSGRTQSSPRDSRRLDLDVLRQRIADLQSTRHLIDQQRLTIQSTQTECRLAIVSRYWKIVERGIGGESKRALVTRKTKECFLRSIMSQDLRFGAQCGIDAFIDQWRYYTSFHAMIHHLPPSLTELVSASNQAVIVCVNLLRVRVSRTTIQQIFPHLMGDEELVQLLIGQELTYPCKVRIYFDANGKIVRHDGAVDFVVGLNAVLHSRPRVTHVMNGAQITHGAVIVRPEQ